MQLVELEASLHGNSCPQGGDHCWLTFKSQSAPQGCLSGTVHYVSSIADTSNSLVSSSLSAACSICMKHGCKQWVKSAYCKCACSRSVLNRANVAGFLMVAARYATAPLTRRHVSNFVKALTAPAGQELSNCLCFVLHHTLEGTQPRAVSQQGSATRRQQCTAWSATSNKGLLGAGLLCVIAAHVSI